MRLLIEWWICRKILLGHLALNCRWFPGELKFMVPYKDAKAGLHCNATTVQSQIQHFEAHEATLRNICFFSFGKPLTSKFKGRR